MTKDILELIWRSLSAKNRRWFKYNKNLIWAVCLCSFHGEFRVGEILARTRQVFDNTKTLLGQDVERGQERMEGKTRRFLVFNLKNTKTSRDMEQEEETGDKKE